MTNPNETKYRPWTEAEALGKKVSVPNGSFILTRVERDFAWGGGDRLTLSYMVNSNFYRQPDGTPCGVALEPEPVAMRACRCGGLPMVDRQTPKHRIMCPLCYSSSAWWTAAAKAAEDWNRLAPLPPVPAPSEPPPTGWNLVEDGLPPDDRDVLAAHGGIQTVAHRCCEKWWAGPDTVQIVGVTHWQPLPEPPEREGAK